MEKNEITFTPLQSVVPLILVFCRLMGKSDSNNCLLTMNYVLCASSTRDHAVKCKCSNYSFIQQRTEMFTWRNVFQSFKFHRPHSQHIKRIDRTVTRLTTTNKRMGIWENCQALGISVGGNERFYFSTAFDSIVSLSLLWLGKYSLDLFQFNRKSLSFRLSQMRKYQCCCCCQHHTLDTQLECPAVRRSSQSSNATQATTYEHMELATIREWHYCIIEMQSDRMRSRSSMFAAYGDRLEPNEIIFIQFRILYGSVDRNTCGKVASPDPASCLHHTSVINGKSIFDIFRRKTDCLNRSRGMCAMLVYVDVDLISPNTHTP